MTNGVSCFQRIIDDIINSEQLDCTFAYIDNVTICGTDKPTHDRNLLRFQQAAERWGITFNEDKSITAVQEIDLLGYHVSEGSIRPDPERFRALRKMKAPTSAKSQQRAVGLFPYYSQWISRFSDKIRPLSQNTAFPLPQSAHDSFEALKKEVEEAVLVTVNESSPSVVETDASDVAISATLNQEGRPVAFFSRTLTSSERNHSAMGKEVYAIVEAIGKWRHYLINSPFKLVTDQKSVAFIYDKKSSKRKIKNAKIQRWKIELSPFVYDVVYRPGPQNHAPDALSRCNAMQTGSPEKLLKLHESLCHPGVTRMWHFVRQKNLP